MALFVFDTDMLTLLRIGHREVSQRVKTASPNELAATVISVDETLSGWYTVIRRVTKPVDIEEAYGRLLSAVGLLSHFHLLNFTQAAISLFDQLVELKLNVGKNDLPIAAIAITNSATVVTRNVRDFSRIPRLMVDDWSQAFPQAPIVPPTP